MLSYQNLAEHLPPNSLEFVGQNQLKLNLSRILESDNLNPNVALLPGVAELLNALVNLTTAINQDRMEANPPLSPIVFAQKELTGTLSAPIIRFTVDLKVNGASFMDNLLDPLE